MANKKRTELVESMEETLVDNRETEDVAVEAAVPPVEECISALENGEEVNSGGAEEPSATDTAADEHIAHFTIRILPFSLRIHKGPGFEYNYGRVLRRSETYLCTDVQDGWARLASGEGWVRMDDVETIQHHNSTRRA